MNTFGRIFRVSIYGESHGLSTGVIVDGVKPGIKLDSDDFTTDIERRKPHKSSQTKRIEADNVNIESGVFNGYTTGTPIMLRFLNQNQNSKDYSNLVDQPRPGHCDFTFKEKYNGFNDYRGGGSSSGRITVGLVAAGVIAKKIVPFEFKTELVKLGDLDDLSKKEEYLEEIAKSGDSVGGVLKITVSNMQIGLGEPYFYSCESAISQILYSIGGIKGVSFGDGFDACELKGSSFNDLIIDEKGTTSSNHSGGINGGITNGNDLVINVFMRPTASIYKKQETFNFKEGKVTELQIEGRHDAAIIERAMVVCENAVAIALADLYLLDKALK